MKCIIKVKNQLEQHKYPVLSFFLLSLIPFYWLRGHPIGFGDTGLYTFFYNSGYLFNVFKYTWTTQLTGYHFGQSISLLPISGLFNLLASMGFNYYVQQSLVYFIVLFVSMIFTYLFVYELFDYRYDKKLIAASSAIFYVFNPLSMINYWYIGMLSIYLIPFIPIIFFIFLLLLRKRKFAYVLLISFVVSLFSVEFYNPAFVIPVLMLLLMFFLYRIILAYKNKHVFKNMLKYTFFSTGLILLTSAWFIIPLIASTMDYYISAITLMNPFDALIEASNSVSLNTFFRIIPLRLDAGIGAYKYPSWRNYYETSYFILLGILIFSIIIMSILFEKKDKNVLFLSLLLITGFFLNLGLNKPFGQIFNYIFIHIPFFNIFRLPYSKFMPFLLVSSSILFGIGITSIYNLIKPKIGNQYSKITVTVLLILICGVYVFPMWTGSVLNSPVTIRGNEISSYIEVPSYYQNISKFFDADQGDYRILSLPLRPSTYVGFKWKYGYDGPDLTWLLYKHKTISYLSDNYYSSTKIISNSEEQNLNDLYEITSIFGIKYIVIQNDVDIVHGNYGGKKLMNQQDLKSLLNQLNVTYIRSFGKLDVYRVSDIYYLPSIYTTPSQTNIFMLDDLLPTIKSNDFNFGQQSIIISSQNQNKINPKINSLTHPSILFQKTNPTKYKIIIENASEPFWLIFSESFHPSWQAYINTDMIICNPINVYSNINVTECQHESKFFEIKDLTRIFGESIPEERHFVVNGYANGWYVNPQELGTGENFTITLNFKSQFYFHIGLIISCLTFFVCISYLLFCWIRKTVYKKSDKESYD